MSEPQKEQSLTESWQPGRIRELSDLIDRLDNGASIFERLEGETSDEMETRIQRVRDDTAKIQEYGGTEGAIRIIGAAVAAEADRRANFDADKFKEEEQEFFAQNEQRIEELKERIDQLKQEIDDSEETKAYLKALDEFNNMTTNDMDERLRIRDEMRDMRDAVCASDKYIEGQSLMGELDKAHFIWRNKEHPEAKAHLTRLSARYLELLSEIRPMGGTVSFKKGTKKEAKEAVQNAAKYFPSDWIEASNAHPSELGVRISPKRAHYVGAKEKKTRTKKQYEDLVEVEDWVLKSHAKDDTTDYEPFTDEEWKALQGREPYLYTDNKRNSFYRRLHFETYEGYGSMDAPDAAPGGTGWVRGMNKAGTKMIWRRPSMQTTVTVSSDSSELVTNYRSSKVDQPDGYAQVSAHEFTHRMEHTVAGISSIELEFIVRRTVDEDGLMETPVAMYGGRKSHGSQELSRSDHFVDVYMGKTYVGQSRYHEVMSTGVEAVFFGAFGGLVGTHDKPRDEDMRAFVLGVLASVGKKKS